MNKGAFNMNEKVEKLLAEHKMKSSIENDIYYYMVLDNAKLLSNETEFYPATKEEYDSYTYDNKNRKILKGSYFVKKRLPLDLTDEEFKAVESTFPSETLQLFKDKASGKHQKISISLDNDNIEVNSTAATFFTILGTLLWLVGLILAILTANISVTIGTYYTHTEQQFSFPLFMSTFIIYFISGCFSFCAAELFKTLQTIVYLLKIKK